MAHPHPLHPKALAAGQASLALLRPIPQTRPMWIALSMEAFLLALAPVSVWARWGSGLRSW
jgi:hypothetical protein